MFYLFFCRGVFKCTSTVTHTRTHNMATGWLRDFFQTHKKLWQILNFVLHIFRDIKALDSHVITVKFKALSCGFPAVGLNCATRTEGQRTRCQTRVLTSQTTPPSGPLTSRTADLQSRRPCPPLLKVTPVLGYRIEAHRRSLFQAASRRCTFSRTHRFTLKFK